MQVAHFFGLPQKLKIIWDIEDSMFNFSLLVKCKKMSWNDIKKFNK